jgi:hypothetical protein
MYEKNVKTNYTVYGSGSRSSPFYSKMQDQDPVYSEKKVRDPAG